MTQLSISDQFEVLAHQQRRILLAELNRMQDEWRPTTDALAEPEMKHNHLPRLADYGVIEWNSQRTGIRPGPNFDDVVDLLELAFDRSEQN